MAQVVGIELCNSGSESWIPKYGRGVGFCVSKEAVGLHNGTTKPKAFIEALHVCGKIFYSSDKVVGEGAQPAQAALRLEFLV